MQLRGGDVVMKGAPWIPLTAVVEQPQDGPVQGVSMGVHCDDRWFSNYTCTTFSAEDAKLFKSKGWNFVRLGVVWAGGQPTPEPKLDADFETRLHAFLDLCHEHGIHVLLDVHEDSVGAATCGEGAFGGRATASHGSAGKNEKPLSTTPSYMATIRFIPCVQLCGGPNMSFRSSGSTGVRRSAMNLQ